MREYLKDVLNTFCIINTGIIIGAAAFINLFQGGGSIGVELLWQILIVSVLTSIIIIVLYSKKVEINKNQALARGVIQYVLINVLTLTCAYFFKWIDFKSSWITIGLILTILFVYIFTWIISYLNDAKVAKQLNMKINEYNQTNQK